MKLLYKSVHVEKLAGRTEGNRAARDLFLLVMALSETQGIQLLKEIFSDVSLHQLPIAILQARSSEAARVFGVKNGDANDSEHTGIAQAKRFLRRMEAGCNPERVIEAGELVIDPTTYCVSRPGKTVRLTSLEFRLLYYLASHPNRYFTRKQLLSALWEAGHGLKARIVDVYVRRLRVKIEPEPSNPVHLKTRTGFGYVFN